MVDKGIISRFVDILTLKELIIKFTKQGDMKVISIVIAVLTIALTGCRTRTVVVQDDTPVHVQKRRNRHHRVKVVKVVKPARKKRIVRTKRH